MRFLLVGLLIVGIIVATVFVFRYLEERERRECEYKAMEEEVFSKLGVSQKTIARLDEQVVVKSCQTLERYDEVKFFKEDKTRLARVRRIFDAKKKTIDAFRGFLKANEYEERDQYDRLVERINANIANARAYRICVTYISSAGNNLGSRTIALGEAEISKFENDPSLLMGKGEYNKYLKEQAQEALDEKQYAYYSKVNDVIDYASSKKTCLFLKGSAEKVDDDIARLFDRTANGIKKIKSVDSEEWDIIETFIKHIEDGIKSVVQQNEKILNYYQSSDFLKIKETCETLMSSQREFNEYISEKVATISQLFGKSVARNATINEDEYHYLRPYQKTLTPFTAEVSAAVFESAENNPLEYVVKHFYPNKDSYPEQIQKLHLLVGELETLKDAKRIIENYKQEYQQYLLDVPSFVMEEDEAGFYERLGFANIDESVLVVEYVFSYTSGGGKAKRTFGVPMTEETIVRLIKALESKLTMGAFTKEQRALMTNKLRELIKQRDNLTCRQCGNSIFKEPNLLLEIDHIIPVSKGGCTVQDNLQTLCWKCNRAKSNKIAF